MEDMRNARRTNKKKLEGGTIIFAGTWPDLEIIFVAHNDRIHTSFVIKPRSLDLHFTYEPPKKTALTKIHQKVFRIDTEQISKQVNKYQNPRVITSYSWDQNDRLIDVDRHIVPFYQLGNNNILDLKFLKKNRLSKNDLRTITFKFAYVFTKNGVWRGLLCGSQEKNLLIFIKKSFIQKIRKEFRQFNASEPEISIQRERFRQSLRDKGYSVYVK